jgi:hypothetical protein
MRPVLPGRLLSLALLVSACTNPVEPRDLGQPMASPLIWREYWQDVWTRCGSTQRARPAWEFSAIEFRVVAGPSVPWNGKLALGAWQGNRIYIAETMLDVPLVVRHEMLHAQLGRTGHPAIFATCDSLAQ